MLLDELLHARKSETHAWNSGEILSTLVKYYDISVFLCLLPCMTNSGSLIIFVGLVEELFTRAMIHIKLSGFSDFERLISQVLCSPRGHFGSFSEPSVIKSDIKYFAK